MDALEVARRLAIMTGMFWNGIRLSTWLFSQSGKLYFTTSIYEKQLLIFLKASGCLDYALQLDKTLQRPFVMGDEMGLVWAGEYVSILSERDAKQFVLIGPMFSSEISLRFLEERMQGMEISLTLRRSCLQALNRIPVLEMPVLCQYIKMLHSAIYNEEIAREDFIYQHSEMKGMGEKRSREVHFTDYERAISREQTILQCIREGNRNYKSMVGEDIQYVIPDDYRTGDPLREAKDTVLMFTVLCSRAAIQGGLSVKEAKELEMDTIRAVERGRSVAEVIAIRARVLDEYVNRVSERKLNAGISQPIRDCCNYIQAHLMEKIELSEIAKSVGYTEYYLSRKFQKEMGVKLQIYIRDARLEYAKVWLVTTDRSIQEICDRLMFGTRSYFTRSFKEREGLTPAQYRVRIKESRQTAQTARAAGRQGGEENGSRSD